MRKVADYKKHAEECRALARTVPLPEQRAQLLTMAETWEALADQHIRQNTLDKPQI